MYDLPTPPAGPGAPLVAGPYGPPVGSIIAFAGEVGPEPGPGVTDPEALGWFVCDGRRLKRAQYPELYAALGPRYNKSGDDSAGFRLPDYRGLFLRAVTAETAAAANEKRKMPNGKDGAGQVGSRQSDAMLSHQHHYQTAPTAKADPSGKAVASTASTKATTEKPIAPGLKDLDEHLSPKETRAANMSVYYLIRFTRFA